MIRTSDGYGKRRIWDCLNGQDLSADHTREQRQQRTQQVDAHALIKIYALGYANQIYGGGLDKESSDGSA